MKLRILARPHDPNAYNADWQSRVWRWLESHPLADRMHRWVVDADGEIVGHLAALPQYYRINGRRVVAHTPADYMVLPEYGFHAITLMRKFFRACENCVACDVTPGGDQHRDQAGSRRGREITVCGKTVERSRDTGFSNLVARTCTATL